MAKRKFGASVVILCFAAITLISGTYAWFLVGGFANLFDIGFDVIEATGGILLQGDAGTAENGGTDWGTNLERADFTAMSFISEGGKYSPISSVDASSFLRVDLKNDIFTSGGAAPSKATATSPSQICYNDFTFRIKSDADAIPGDASTGAFVQIQLNGDKANEDGSVTEDADNADGAAVAARVAVTVNGTTTLYSIDGETYSAVTAAFGGEITDTNNNRIIDAADTNSGAAGLTTPSNYATLRDGDSAVKIYLGEIPSSTTTGKEVNVKIWLEGNDKDCVDFADNTIAGKSLMSRISFGITE